MFGLEKILAEHLERRAFIYARQSTPAQVIHHRSSTERQIGLADRASELGWSSNLIDVVTDDLGQSGRYVEGREGFQRLASEMTMGGSALCSASMHHDWRDRLQIGIASSRSRRSRRRCSSTSRTCTIRAMRMIAWCLA